jgi:hypothetical protein
MIDPDTSHDLNELEAKINILLDRLIIKRDEAIAKEKQAYRYVTNKVQQALTSINKALDRIESDVILGGDKL